MIQLWMLKLWSLFNFGIELHTYRYTNMQHSKLHYVVVLLRVNASKVLLLRTLAGQQK